ncbi:autotransporter domain-containing protein [Methylobacterium sp. J-030]|uniref:autotransporter domain-containing protein n=1 Tax=Methylobacterium sp. J-030 TaxID=2836627 RepID=UPI001FB863AE|nr:autotransporter domain-containing protein [Methylobacterium sp. J-030]MCJ2069870.1 autotransporter domain-containing protein [Methylobacterium sp. J-030]
MALGTGGAFDISAVTGAGSAITGLADTAAGQAGTVRLGAKTLTLTGAGGSFGGTIGGTGGLILAAGTETFTGANTYSGGTALNGGTLRVSADANLGAAAGRLSFSGGTLATAASFATARTVALDAGGGTVAPDAGTTLTASGVVSGSGPLTVAGPGTVVLTGANTYTGATLVTGGVLNIRHASALGAADGTAATGTTVASGAALELQGGIAVGTEALSIAGTGVRNGGALRSISGDNGFAGPITLADSSRIDVDADTLTLSGGLSGAAGADRDLILGGAATGIISGAIAGHIGALVKDGTGTWTLTGQSTLGGDARIDGGALRLEAGGGLSGAYGSIASSLGSSGRATVTGSGSRWTAASDLSVGHRGTGTLAVAAGGTVSVGTNGTGTVTVADQAGSTGTLAIGAATGQAAAAGTVQAGEVHFGAGTGRLVFDHTGNPDGTAVTFAPKITGAGGVSQLAGTTVLTAANTYTGGTTISGGMLEISSDANLGATVGALSFDGGTLATTADVASARTVTLNAGGGTFAPGAVTTLTASGTVGGAGGLMLAGPGTLALVGANTYSGATTITAGVLNIRSSTALGAADGTAATGTTVASGAALELQGGIAVGNEALSLAGTGVSGFGALRSISGDNSYAGSVTLTDDSRINADAGLLTVSGSITGTGSSPFDTWRLTLGGAGDGAMSGTIGRGIAGLSKDGAGTWTLTGANTVAADTTVRGGRLRITGGGTMSDAFGTVDAAGGSTADVTVMGTNSRWTNTNGVKVGASGRGALTIAHGGAASGGSGTIGADRGSVGTVTVTGAKSAWTHSFNLYVGQGGTGTMTVADRGAVSNTIGYIGNGAGSSGSVTVTGADSRWTSSIGLIVGSSGTGTLTVAEGATVAVTGGALTLAQQHGSTGTLAIGAPPGQAAVPAGTISAAQVTFGAGSGTLVFNHTGNPDGSAVTFAPVIAGAGSVQQRAGTTILTGANTYTGGTTVSAGTLALSGAGTLGSATAAATVKGATSVLDLGGTRQIQAAVTLADGATLLNGALTAPVASSGGTLARIAGTATLTTTGGTTVSTANRYTGATTVGDGSILKAGGAGGFSAASAYTLAGSGTLDLAGASNIVGALAGASPAALVTSSAGGSAVLTVAGLSAGTFAGTIGNGAGAVGLTLAGAGALTLTGTSSYTGATTIGAGATLRLGDGGTAGAIPATSGVANAGTLVFDRADTVAFAPAISGSGSLTQAGTGTTVLAGRNTYTGATTVAAGTLQIDGVLTASEVTVKRGGTLAGSGKIGDPLIEAGGTLAPGSATAIGTLSIHGPLTFAPGSFYTVKVTPTANDRTAVTGPVTIQGGTVQVLAGSGTYIPALRYTLLTATGGVTGRFNSLRTTSNLAFLTPSLAYDATSVSLGFAQTAPLTSRAATPNQTGTAAALNGAGPRVTSTVAAPAAPAASAAAPTRPSVTTQVSVDGTTTTTVTGTTGITTVVSSPAAQVATAVLNQTAAGATQALTVLSGEVHATAIAAVAQSLSLIQGPLLDRLRFDGPGFVEAGLAGRFAPGATVPAAYAADGPGEPVLGLVALAPVRPSFVLWGQGLGTLGSTRGDGNAARVTRDLGGFVFGLETAPDLSGLDEVRVGVAAGYGVAGFEIPARLSSGREESAFGGVYGGAALGPLRLRAGAVYGSQALDTRRWVTFPGFSQSVTGKVEGDLAQGFGQVGYRFARGAASLEPFVGGTALHLRRDGFTERGGAAALRVFGRGYDVQTASLGLQGTVGIAEALGLGLPVAVRGSLGYQRAFGDVVPRALMAFGGGRPFETAGVPLARDALMAAAAIDARVAEDLTLGVAYSGQVGGRAQDHTLRGTLSLSW